ncbi:hypothetical protein PILCRDRAFT_85437 [Piloderma croceum F 1598]|uniref:Ricin B lectin domain-containing protein n=1 Tax=Piloderma croceum (strain F 1598) TaxID=765440 RepID=A0A0C3BNV2_PILCF|nr:hypothetical protein PILCRDRAFT_85437 [Piloderma croceum F 1598]
MPALDTGRYIITNVKYGNLAVLPDANDESDIIAGVEENNPGEKWNVTLLNNRKFTIKNHGFDHFAGCETRPEKGDTVFGRERNKQWVIRETRIKGRYTISPTDGDVFWGLPDGESETPITLASTPNDSKNQWTFTETSA